MTLSRRRAGSTFAAVVALVGVGAAVGSALGFGSRSAERGARINTSVFANRPGSPALSEAFAVFRPTAGVHTAAADPGLPAGVPRAAVIQRFGLQLASARYVATGASFHIWLIPGSLGVCMLWPEAAPAPGVPAIGSACTSVSNAEDGRLNSQDWVTPGSNDRTLFGIAPNGNSNVTVIGSDGVSTTVPVTDNVFAIRRAAPSRSVSLKAASGAPASFPTLFGPGT